jgi:methylthioribose-1-phosphate isomerase
MQQSIKWEDNNVILIDQTKLPGEVYYKRCTDYHQIADSIKRLEIRGAPAIGIAGAMGFALGMLNADAKYFPAFEAEAERIAEELASTRPTAVNLFWALERMRNVIKNNADKSLDEIKRLLIQEVQNIHEEDRKMCRQIGENGAELIENGFTILTHCNTGFLATGGIGTALGTIYVANEQGKDISVYVDETRPLLQGARLNMWELDQAGIAATLITDNMAGWVMKTKNIDCVILGADRIARNGDTANKIGTYSLAVLANHHSIPFYVVAPSSTIDLKLKSGDMIPIEERNPDEVRKPGGNLMTTMDAPVFNPAFDVTPSKLITAIITEKEVFRYPYDFSSE